MNLNLLELFAGVAEASSFSTVAKKQGVRRSSVSRGIAALERELDVQLFSRTTRRVALTTAGAALYQKVAPQLRSLHDAVSSLPEREEAPSGALRLSVPVDIAVVFLPAALAGFTQRYPNIHLQIELSTRVVDLVGEGIDAALRVAAGRLADSSLIARKLSELQMQVFASPTYVARRGQPRSLDDINEHDWAVFGATARPRLPRPMPPLRARPRLVCDDMLFLAHAVKAGVGLGVLPTFLTHADLAAGTLVRVLPKLTVDFGAVYLVHPPTQHVSRKVAALRDYLIEFLGAQFMVRRAQS